MLKEHYSTEPTALDTLVFEKLVPPDHCLRRVTQGLDFERCHALVKDCYSPVLGHTAEEPVRMLKLAFLQFHYHLSDREVIAAAQVNVAFRVFLDRSLESPLPVPSVLVQCRTDLPPIIFGEGMKKHEVLLIPERTCRQVKRPR